MLLVFPSDDVIWIAVLTMSNEDADYPVENAQDNDPSNTAKSTTTSTTIQIDLPGNVTVVGLLIVNTNATAGALRSGAGAILTLSSFPALTPDGKLRNKWFDLRSSPNRTDDHFEIDLSKTGSAVLEFGRICLVVEYQAPEVLVEGAGSAAVKSRIRPGQVENVSRGGTTWRRTVPWAPIRALTISTLTAEAREILDQLEAECNGLGRGFLLVENDDDTDAMFAQCEFAPFETVKSQPDSVDEIGPVRMKIVEIAMGLQPDRA